MNFHSNHYAEKYLPSLPRANLVPEEKATEQYYKKTPEEENWEIGEMDSWEIYQTMIDQIKETSRPSTILAILQEYHEFLEVFTEKELTAPPSHHAQDHYFHWKKGKLLCMSPYTP